MCAAFARAVLKGRGQERKCDRWWVSLPWKEADMEDVRCESSGGDVGVVGW